MFCGSRTFGKSCPYSPVKIHIHIDDPKKCIYCGSFSYGSGCPYNPSKRKIHVHGANFNSILKDNVCNSSIAGYLMNKMAEPITESEAFKLGLVNEKGMQIRNPENEIEEAALTPADIYINKIKRNLGNKIDLMNESTYLTALAKNEEKQTIESYEKEINLKERVENIVRDLYNSIEDGKQQGLSSNILERIIIESFLNHSDE
jgi:hypothetical protein